MHCTNEYARLIRAAGTFLAVIVLALPAAWVSADNTEVIGQAVGDFSGTYPGSTSFYPAHQFTPLSTVDFASGSLAVGGDSTSCGNPVIRDAGGGSANFITFDAGTYDSGTNETDYAVTGGSATTLTSGTTYSVLFGCNGGGFSAAGHILGTIVSDGSTQVAGRSDLSGSFTANTSSPFQWQWTLCLDANCRIGGGSGGANNSTRITAVVPPDQSVIATSSSATVGATVFVNASDFTTLLQSGNTWFVRVTYQLTAPAFSPASIGKHSFDFPITDSGFSVFSTTTSILSAAQYTLTAQIRSSGLTGSILSFVSFGFLDPNVIAATSTTFLAASQSVYDQYLASSTATLKNFINNPFDFLSSTSTASDCSFTDLPACVAALFSPDGATLLKYTTLGDTLTRKPPIGYFTAAGRLIASTTASSTASFSIPYASFVAGTLGTLEDGLAAVLWVLTGWWVFHRLRKFNFQS